MNCSPPWRGARSILGCATAGWSWRASRRNRSIRATTIRRPRTGFDRVLIAPSIPLGIEWLPEAEEMLEAFHAGVLALGAPFELWAGLVLADPSPERVDALLDRGAVGLSLPAGALERARRHRGPRSGAGAARGARPAAVRASRARPPARPPGSPR